LTSLHAAWRGAVLAAIAGEDGVRPAQECNLSYTMGVREDFYANYPQPSLKESFNSQQPPHPKSFSEGQGTLSPLLRRVSVRIAPFLVFSPAVEPAGIPYKITIKYI
jgi:hypothetical protein